MKLVKKKKKKLRLHVPSKQADKEAKPPESDLKQKLGELRQKEMFEEEKRRADAAERIRRLTRPYSMGFGGLPVTRQVSDQIQGKMLEDIETDKDSVTSSKKLLGKHPLVTKLHSARGICKGLFEKLTLPYVVEGQRLFAFDGGKIDFENWPQEQIEQEMARQRSEFETKINIPIQEYLVVAKEVAAGWTDILVACKSRLKQLYDERDYLKAEEVEARLYVNFGPEGVLEASTESRFMPRELQTQESQRMRDRFEAVVRLQEEAFIAAFNKSLNKALSMIGKVDSGEQKKLFGSVIENLFETFVDFRNKCLRYGMLTGTKVEKAVQDAVKALDADNMKVNDVTEFIRKSDSRRKHAIESLSKVAETMAEVAIERGSARVIYRRDDEED